MRRDARAVSRAWPGVACTARGAGHHGGAQCGQRGRGRGLPGPPPALRPHPCGEPGNFGERCCPPIRHRWPTCWRWMPAPAPRPMRRRFASRPDVPNLRRIPMLTVVAFIVALGLLIAVHEYGHYRVAVACGVKVLRFSVGFGKTLYRWQPKRQHPGQNTEFVIGAFPLGGYVKMLDEREGPVAPEERHRAFNTQPLRSRAAIVAAGPIANLLLAVLLYTRRQLDRRPGAGRQAGAAGGGLAGRAGGSARRRARHARRLRRRAGAGAVLRRPALAHDARRARRPRPHARDRGRGRPAGARAACCR